LINRNAAGGSHYHAAKMRVKPMVQQGRAALAWGPNLDTAGRLR